LAVLEEEFEKLIDAAVDSGVDFGGFNLEVQQGQET
jgi:hypothetical protein